jgi:hypothetical protein
MATHASLSRQSILKLGDMPLRCNTWRVAIVDVIDISWKGRVHLVS